MLIPGRPLSQLNQVNDLLPTDFVTILRPSEPLPEDQNTIMRGDRLAEILGTGITPPVPSFPLYAGPGSHTDGPLHQLAATQLANRGPNTAPSAATHIVRYARATDPRYTAGIHTLDTLEATPGLLGLKHRIEVIDPLPGEPEAYRVMYAAGGFDCYRDGSNTDLSEGEFVDIASPRAQAQPYAYYGPAYAFIVDDIVRAVPTDATDGAEVFFSPTTDGPRPAPTLAIGDANWRRVAPPVAVAAPTYRVIDVATAQAMAADPDTIQPIRYRILRDLYQGDVETFGLPTDQANNRPGAFSERALRQIPATGRWEPVLYDVATDNTYGAPWREMGGLGNEVLLAGDNDGNTFGIANRCLLAFLIECVFGDGLLLSQFVACETVTVGLNGTHIQAANITLSTIGDNCSSLLLFGSQNLTIGDNCQRVEVYHCDTLVIPNGTTDAVYRNNVLVPSTSFDPYISATGTIGAAVTAGTFTNGELDGTQPSGSQAGMTFTTTTHDYTYKRGAAGTLVWVRLIKG